MPDWDEPLDGNVIFRNAAAVRERAGVRRFAARLRQQVAGGRDFCCLVTGDRELRRLNREFLGRDYPADVLSFPSEGPDGFLGEMAISADRAREQAERYGHQVSEEISILMLHGLLHLMGMDHESDRGQMRRTEARWRKRLLLPAGLIERARA